MSADSLTDRLWSDIDRTYAAILAHPFLKGIADGTLPKERFRYFILQDARYLQVYARALSSIGGKAPLLADTEFFATRSAVAIGVEHSLHEGLLKELGLDRSAVEATEPSPTTLAYTSYILAQVHGGSFADGLASVLPCYWIYRRMGCQLAEPGSPDPLYQRWLQTYASPEFGQAVDSVVALADRVGETLGEHEVARVRTHFSTASRYEWMFWDAAWREEGWALERAAPTA